MTIEAFIIIRHHRDPCLFYFFFNYIFSLLSLVPETEKQTNTMAAKPTMTFFLLSIVCLNVVQVLAQSNYASHGNNINYIGNGLPEETLLDGKVSDIEPFPNPVWVITVSHENHRESFRVSQIAFSCQLSTPISANEKSPNLKPEND